MKTLSLLTRSLLVLVLLLVINFSNAQTLSGRIANTSIKVLNRQDDAIKARVCIANGFQEYDRHDVKKDIHELM